MSTKRLRQYQTETLEALDRDRTAGLNRLVALLFTGAGKTFTMAHVGLRHVLRGDGRILVITHRAELADQIVAAFTEVIPWRTVGRVKAQEANDVNADIVVASQQTLMNKARRDQITGVGLILVDECHHGVSPSWMTILEHFGAFDGIPTIGFTATLSRHDQLGLGDLWQKVSIKRSIEWGVKNGFLVPTLPAIDYQVPNLELIDAEPDENGDYTEEVIAKALIDANAAPEIARMHLREMVGRRTITFAPNKAVAVLLADAYRASGIKTDVVLGDTKREDRKEIYAAHRAGRIQDIVNVGVLTEGYDDPGVSGIVILNVVRSEVKYIQEVGRGTRIAEGKTDCKVIRAAGTTLELTTPADLRKSAAPHRRTPRKAPATAPPPRSDVYRAKRAGNVVRVWRGDVLIAKKAVKPGTDPARLARLLIDLDIATRKGR